MNNKPDKAKEARLAYDVDDPGSIAPSIGFQEQFVVDRQGKKVGVLLPFEQYQQMQEDLHDLAMVAERREEAPISLDEMKQRLAEDGLL